LANLDGTTTTISVGGETKDLNELINKLNENSGGKFSASIGEDGYVRISAENVSSITVTDAGAALGTGITTAAQARLVLTSDDGNPVTVTRGATGTLEQLNFLGFRENDEQGIIEGHAVGATALAVGDLKINGVDVGSSETGGLNDKLDAINSVTDQTGVTAAAFSTTSIDFGAVALSTLVGGAFSMNGVEMTIAAGTATTTLADIAEIFNDEVDSTGVTATVSGTRLILEGNVSSIAFSLDSGGTVGIADALTDGGGAIAQLALAGDEANAADIANDDVVDGGIQLKSLNGNPISVDVKDATAATKVGLVDSNAVSGGSFGTAIASLSIDTVTGAQKAISVIDNALTTINDTRASLGAVNNRLDFTVSNLSSIVEKTTAARSRIVDADFAVETANLSRSQVLQQASTAMLAQANARAQNVLSLLR
jgi:flagellin